MAGRRCLHLICAALVAQVAGCGVPPYPRGSVDQLFAGKAKPELRVVQIDGKAIAYAEIPASTPDGPPILFIHGSPGDWQAWAGFMQDDRLRDFGPRIAVDRPGFGDSKAAGVMPDLRAQAALLAALLPPGQKSIVVGHSLGSPLTVWLALDHPDKVCAVVSVAGSVASQYEAPRWYNGLADSWLGRLFASPELLQSNHEIMALQAQLVALEAALPRLQVPLLLIQGGKDRLVDPREADDWQARANEFGLPIEVQRFPEAGHFIHWQQPAVLFDALDKVRRDCQSPLKTR